MPVAYYLIPMVSGPYSRDNRQRPQYVDEILCNWTGHNVDAFGFYVCKVNSTDTKLADLASRTGVLRLPNWDTVISTLPPPIRNAASRWCSDHGIVYDSSETVGQFVMRVINSGLFGLANEPLTTTVGNLGQAKRDNIAAYCQKWGIAYSDADTLRALSDRCGNRWWHGPSLAVEEF